MPNIDSTNRFLVQMREQVSAAARQVRLDKAAPARTARTPEARAGHGAQSLVLQRVLAIPADDPQRRRKAFRIFLESVLADELGKDLLTDPAYHRIVEDVHRTMERNSALAAAIDKAGEYLLESAHQR